MEFFGITDLAGIAIGSLALFLMVVFALGNYIDKEAKTGQTIGKKLMGIMTISKDGSKANLSAIVVRNIFRPADLVLGYGVGLGFILISPKNQRLGDYFARTTVVRVID